MVFNVTLRVAVPEVNALFGASVAIGSLEERRTESAIELTRFQFASTAFTVVLNATPAVRAAGVPVFPLAVPGAAVSPGTRSWSFVKAPAFTVNVLLVPFAVPPVWVAVMVLLSPLRLSVTPWVTTPPTKFVDTVGVIVPALVVRFTVPVNPVTVKLPASRAVIRMLNDVPAACVPISPPPSASTRKLVTSCDNTIACAVLVQPLAELVTVTVYVPEELTLGFAVAPPEMIPGPAQLKPFPVVVLADRTTDVVVAVSVPPVALAPGIVVLTLTVAVAVLVQPVVELVTVTV